jgi:hypothetical protein
VRCGSDLSDMDILSHAMIEQINELLGQVEYRRLFSGASDELEAAEQTDDLGFLIEKPLVHAAMLKHEQRNADMTERQRRAWTDWLSKDAQPMVEDGGGSEGGGSVSNVGPLLRGGIPVELRAAVYARLLAPEIEKLQSGANTSFQHLIEQAVEEADAASPDDVHSNPMLNIKKDLDRTFPGHDIFSTEQGTAALRDVLSANVALDPKLGYCQSMNFIAAVMIVVMGAEDKAQQEQAFWSFAWMERIVRDYHTESLVGSRVDSRVLLSLVDENLPKLAEHLKANGVIPEISFISWFMCLFVNTLPIKTALRVWDCLLPGGNSNVLLRVGLALLASCARVLLAAPTPFDVNQTLQEAPQHLHDADSLLDKAFQDDFCTDKTIEQLRRRHRNAILDEERQLAALRQEKADEEILKHHLLEGHTANEQIVKNAGSAVLELMDGNILRGTVFVTTYRVAIIPQGVVCTEPIGVPLLAIDSVNLKSGGEVKADGSDDNTARLELAVKDGRKWNIIYADALVVLLERLQQCSETGVCPDEDEQVRRFRKKLAQPGSSSPATPAAQQKLQALRQHIESQMTHQSQTPHSPFLRKVAAEGENHVYDAHKEFERQGVFRDESTWRETEANHDHELCPTYASVLIVPKEVTDQHLRDVAEFRSKQRLPVLSWIDSESQAAIVRCAQPLVGLTGKKSEADEQYFDCIIRANPQDRGMSMLDARPYVNALANKGKGGGYEDVSRYDAGMATLLFLDIGNIHVMRDSLQQMHALLTSTDKAGPIRRIEFQTGWLAHTGRVLGGAATIVREVGEKKRSALVHCSDGWDRTAQLCSLSEICLDKHYRTLQGFQTVCQREWQSFGHKFRDRLWSHPDKLKERSPIFFQFLDCVHQLLEHYPNAFEFNHSLLLFLVDAMYSMAFTDFRYNCHRERHAAGPEPSLWTVVHNTPSYRNPDFVEYTATLKPPPRARVWTQYFNRWVNDPVCGQVDAPEGCRMAAPQYTLDQALSNGPVPDMHKPLFVESTPAKEGWIFQSTGHEKPKLRRLVLFPSVHGEAYLVFFKQEKSQSEVPAEVIPLVDGGFKVLRMPKRSEPDKYWLQLKYSSAQSWSAGLDDESTTVEVKNRKKQVFEVPLQQGQRAQWQASIQKYDLAFQVRFTTDDSGEETAQSDGMIGDPKDKDKGGTAKGSFRAPVNGTLKLILDNSYSKMRSKEVSYFLGLDDDGDGARTVEEIAEMVAVLTQEGGEEGSSTSTAYTGICSAAGSARSKRAAEIAQLLSERLSEDSTAVKMKALDLMGHLNKIGSVAFKTELRKGCMLGVRGLCGEPAGAASEDTAGSDSSLTAMCQKAQMVSSQFVAAGDKKPAAARQEYEEKLLICAKTEEEGEAWVKALQEISGAQIEPGVASDDEEPAKGPSFRRTFDRFTDELASTGIVHAAAELLPPSRDEIDIVIKARKEQYLEIQMVQGQEVRWELQLDNYDIKWQAVFTPATGEPTSVAPANSMIERQAGQPDSGSCKGGYSAPSAGTVKLLLDNSYSKVRRKQVRCAVELFSPGGEKLSCSFIPIPKTGFKVFSEGAQ